ncbi:dihydroxyacetone kinase, L subunit [Selenomonas sp. oral taxon 137 str. F0430]|uniref:dihydroxyacetone kinase subunit DhaL n=1 Tax=Selenomonas sp. oral taxon 137 TaxID=712531 RepID=UPI0001EB2F0C|nr:dihydroxyacetone kinase subunit DhaL [Selenomonas sp. oral taxon 137]EFR39817.1 dihydroxyacetone kinase, L subunit [Selenomonas sp. oral taxon 137 str. F0430]
MDIVRKEELTQILDEIVRVMEGAKEELLELDGAMGDGDLGLTMVHGFTAVAEEIRALDETDMGKLMMKLGMKMNSTVPSTMGTLIATCFLKAAPAAKGKTQLTLADLAEMGKGAVAGVMERGKSKPGDKTMLDALYPAVEALGAAAAAGDSLAAAWKKAYEAAKDGVEKTKSMQSVHGRAAYYQEKSIGRQDPGATAVMYMIKGIAQAVQS